MNVMKSLFLTLCFAVLCAIFYLFFSGNSGLQRHPNTIKRLINPLRRFPFVVAYSDQDIAQCGEVMKPIFNEINSTNRQWKNISHSNLFLYSAFYDDRFHTDGKTKNFIRILGMSEGQIAHLLYCRIWYASNQTTVAQVQQEEIWIQNWDNADSTQYYRPYILSCPLPDKLAVRNSLPTAVSLVRDPCDQPDNILTLQSRPPQRSQENFVVCLKAMDFNDDISLRFIEWIELQFLLGADKISTYLFKVHPNILKVLKYYENLGRLTINLHTLPGKDPNEPVLRSNFLKTKIWQKRRHEIIPYNDCFYNHISSHKFVVILDLDEAIIPTQHDTWSELLDYIFLDQVGALLIYSSLSVSNVYFFDAFGTYTKDDAVPSYMHMLRHIYRSANFSTPGFAVKSFFATNNTLALFNHYTLFPLYSGLRRNALISRHLAQLHHYRATCPPLMEKECQTNFMKFYKKDTVIWKFKKQLVENVRRVVKELHFV